ncbi:LTR Retrotransposon, partial [Pseudoloma neurophilia]
LSKIDLESAYHQIEIHEDDQAKTGFITHSGFYEWTVMPFGLVAAPFTFQRIINHVFKEALNKFVICYLDDILIYSRTQEEHYKHLEWVFNRLGEVGLKANLKKCEFLKKSVQFLGFNINDGKFSIRSEHQKKATDFRTPSNKKEIQMFL